MITNRMLININRNERQLNTLYEQMSTGKQIQVPSDNPILASRALKFRTNVTQTEQYQRNVSQGLSWMNTTEGAMTNENSILSRLRELAVQGASDENGSEDRQAIATNMAQLIDQLGKEMNATYAGRYVLSGYRTDEPPTFEKNQPDTKYLIAQDFKSGDIEVMSTYWRDPTQNGGADIVKTDNVNVIKLPYSGIDETTFAGINVTHLDGSVNPYVVTTPGTINFIPETGELVLSDDTANALKDGSTFRVHYEKLGFSEGDINPKVYFDCIDLNTGKEYNMDNQTMQYEFGVNTRIAVNSLAKDSYSATMFADFNEFVNSINSMTVSTRDQLKAAYPTLTDDEIDQKIIDQQDQVRAIMQNRFNNFLGIIDKHITTATTQHTELGSRMDRLNLIQNRLADDNLSYTKLLSDNEDVDYMQTIMNMNSTQSVYQASLQTGAKITQLTLANFI